MSPYFFFLLSNFYYEDPLICYFYKIASSFSDCSKPPKIGYPCRKPKLTLLDLAGFLQDSYNTLLCLTRFLKDKLFLKISFQDYFFLKDF